jgi:hypothetical protein
VVYVRLEDEWIDDDGVAHSAGESVDVDAATLARLLAEGLVAEPSAFADTSVTDWMGPPSAGVAGPPRGGRPDPSGRPPGPENDEDEW